jgi:hypothetical protein
MVQRQLAYRNHKWRQCSSFVRYEGYCSLRIHSASPKKATKLIIWKYWSGYVKLCGKKRHEVWPNDWILLHDNSPAHKALSVKQFLAQKSITEMNTQPISLTWLFPKIRSALKGRRFRDIEDPQKKMSRWHWKVFHNRSSKNVSNSGK